MELAPEYERRGKKQTRAEFVEEGGPEALSRRRMVPLISQRSAVVDDFPNVNEYRRLRRGYRARKATRAANISAFVGRSANVKALVDKCIGNANRYVLAQQSGRRATLRAVCGDLSNEPIFKGKGIRKAYSAAYNILKIGVKCMKRDMRHQGYIHKNWSPVTRARRLSKKIQRLSDQRAKLGVYNGNPGALD